MQKAYGDVLSSGDHDLAEEVKRRIGHRIRELENGVSQLETLALNQD